MADAQQAAKTTVAQPVKCKRCGKESGTIQQHRVCDRCGAEYVLDDLYVSIFYHRKDLFPADSKRYWLAKAICGGQAPFLFKAAVLICGLLLGIALLIDFGAASVAGAVGVASLIAAAIAAYYLYRGYATGGPKGLFGIKLPELSAEGKRIKGKFAKPATK